MNKGHAPAQVSGAAVIGNYQTQRITTDEGRKEGSQPHIQVPPPTVVYINHGNSQN